MGWLLLMYLPLVLTQAQQYRQSDYTVKFERVQMMSYNQSYLKNVLCGLVHYNRTFRAINCSGYLFKDIDGKFMANVQWYKFLSNEYRFFPVTIEADVCQELKRDSFGLANSFQVSANFRLRCPAKSGSLKLTYGVIDFSHFPPYIPGGQYKSEMKLTHNSHHVASVDVYAQVEEILKIWKN